MAPKSKFEKIVIVFVLVVGGSCRVFKYLVEKYHLQNSKLWLVSYALPVDWVIFILLKKG